MKKVLSLTVIVILLLSLCLPVFAHPPRVVDDGGLLTEDEVQLLTGELDALSEQIAMDVAVVTTDSLEGKTSREYADDYYDANGYGAGSDDSGILLLVCMEDRDWAISTYGEAISVFTDDNQEDIMAFVKPYLSEGEYFQAFSTFAFRCGEVFRLETEEGPFPFLIYLIISLVIGFVVALIVTGVMKGKLKSVRAQAAANHYLKSNSLQVTEARDIFLYRTVTRTAKPKPASSSTHTSSSGRVHGGSSGKF